MCSVERARKAEMEKSGEGDAGGDLRLEGLDGLEGLGEERERREAREAAAEAAEEGAKRRLVVGSRCVWRWRRFDSININESSISDSDRGIGRLGFLRKVTKKKKRSFEGKGKEKRRRRSGGGAGGSGRPAVFGGDTVPFTLLSVSHREGPVAAPSPTEAI
ncbi:hypothetical protein CRG98_040314 [Punica granatum]|uniref:Uncharacterized protein n=1 Tax=Punica granatum TaxID=22663 RepID=A0A2I0I5J5_PUNGR|nr:hypothetical protein CRG98_040314 [Punica granatum]